MGIFSFFKRKEDVYEEQKNFIQGILDKYFEGSVERVYKDASELLEMTKYDKYDLTIKELSILILRCIEFREKKQGWCERTKTVLRRNSSNKLPDVELRWLLVYCDVHYIKDGRGEAMIIMELAGRKIGMPSPLGEVSASYKFD